jgi:chromosomal replication initiation ATPase DnaA
MADITYQVLRKPIEERLIDAACIYWEVPRTYFAKNCNKADSTVVYRRRVLLYLLKSNTIYSLKELVTKFGFTSHKQVSDGVEEVEAQKNIYGQINNDINQITFLASKLDAEFVTTTVSLINKKDATVHTSAI